jgi:hypothetical protein
MGATLAPIGSTTPRFVLRGVGGFVTSQDVQRDPFVYPRWASIVISVRLIDKCYNSGPISLDVPDGIRFDLTRRRSTIFLVLLLLTRYVKERMMDDRAHLRYVCHLQVHV